MGIIMRVNMVLAVAFAFGLGVAAWFSYSTLQDNAKAEASSSAVLLMEAARGAGAYTAAEIQPLLAGRRDFPPQSVPAYSAVQILAKLHKDLPDYSYKAAMLNPTNLKDRASDWEADLIQYFRNQPGREEIVGERNSATGPLLYVAHAIRITDGRCLACHSTAAAAPPEMIALYGTANGFGWKMNEVVGAEIVSVPLAVPRQKAQYSFWVFFASLLAVFLITFGALNILLHKVVVDPIVRMSETADQVSTGDLAAPAFPVAGEDEISRLGKSFNRMRKSLEKLMALLEQH